ncbi:hypothetical protein B0H14DRAFT_2600935 [Mycena olivaceomarginata]|nr:hypothetical protein B0H14DRAFT_2600935 [Mycena olivaceomarginata]
MTNELIGDQWRRPHLAHEPAICCHAASCMQRVHRLEALPPPHFPYTFGVHARTCCVRPSLFLSIHQLTLNLSLPFLSVPFTDTSSAYEDSATPSTASWATELGSCMLEYIRVIVKLMSQPEYGDLIPMFGIVNEACLAGIASGRDVLRLLTSLRNRLQARNLIRGITGNGPVPGHHMVGGLPPGSDRIMHPCFVFDGAPNDSPITTCMGSLKAGGVRPRPSLNTSTHLVPGLQDICLATGPAVILEAYEKSEDVFEEALDPEAMTSGEENELFGGFFSKPLEKVWEEREEMSPASALDAILDGGVQPQADTCRQTEKTASASTSLPSSRANSTTTRSRLLAEALVEQLMSPTDTTDVVVAEIYDMLTPQFTAWRKDESLRSACLDRLITAHLHLWLHERKVAVSLPTDSLICNKNPRCPVSHDIHHIDECAPYLHALSLRSESCITSSKRIPNQSFAYDEDTKEANDEMTAAELQPKTVVGGLEAVFSLKHRKLFTRDAATREDVQPPNDKPASQGILLDNFTDRSAPCDKCGIIVLLKLCRPTSKICVLLLGNLSGNFIEMGPLEEAKPERDIPELISDL